MLALEAKGLASCRETVRCIYAIITVEIQWM